MVLQGRHPEHPPPGELEEPHLDDHRQGDEDEQAAQQDQQQLGAGEDGQPGQSPAEGQRPGVPHEDLGRGGVPPQEAEARAHQRGRYGGQVQRVPDLVAGRAGVVHARVAELPDAHQHVGGEHHDRCAGGQPVQAVGEVHPVGGGGDHQVGDHDEQDRPEVEAGVPDERQVRRRRVDPPLVGEPQGQDGERERHDGLPGQLGLRPQPQAALLDDLDVVVDEADQAQARHQEQDEQPGHPRRAEHQQVTDGVPGQRGQDDHPTAHGRRPSLGVVRGGAVVADQLAVALADEQPDGQRGAQQGEHQRGGAGEQHALHRGLTRPRLRARGARRRPAPARRPGKP